MAGSTVVRTKDKNRCYEFCECCECGKVSECTPTNDYYSTEEHGDLLLCEACFIEYTNKKIK